MNSDPEASSNVATCRLWTWRSYRFRVAVALALALTIEGLMRSNINMAMVCMVNRTAVDAIARQSSPAVTALPITLANETFLHQIMDNGTLHKCDYDDEIVFRSRWAMKKAALNRHRGGELIITKPHQALIFTSFYLGGLFIVIPGSYLVDRFGSKNVVLIGAVINVIGTFITPIVASTLHAYALVFLRFIMGCGQGILVPCMNVLIAHWFPPTERSTAIAVSTTGNQLSVIAAMFLTAELCQFNFLGGWPLAFHSYGIIGVAFCIFWAMSVYNSPSKAKKISDCEIQHIQQSIHSISVRKLSPKDVPWTKILTSPTLWSIALNSFSQNFMTVGTITYIPSYYQTVLRMDLSSNGVMSAMPFVIQLLTKILFAGGADYLRRNNIMTHTRVTKLFNMIAALGSGLCYFLLTFCDCKDETWAIILVISAVGLSSGFIPGYNTSMVCVAPRYTSSVASFCRLFGQIAAVASPYMIGWIVQKGTRDEWNIAFYVIAIVLLSCGLAFQLFGSASVQDWAKTPTPASDMSKNSMNTTLIAPTETDEVKTITCDLNNDMK
uniref:MFS domain-containing protein n=1 Tax=Panagrellus redivivus TaxID=6233 RepID=A0A7E4ZTC0_PANRE